eukprot:gene9490-biopygen13777
MPSTVPQRGMALQPHAHVHDHYIAGSEDPPAWANGVEVQNVHWVCLQRVLAAPSVTLQAPGRRPCTNTNMSMSMSMNEHEYEHEHGHGMAMAMALTTTMATTMVMALTMDLRPQWASSGLCDPCWGRKGRGPCGPGGSGGSCGPCKGHQAQDGGGVLID